MYSISAQDPYFECNSLHLDSKETLLVVNDVYRPEDNLTILESGRVASNNFSFRDMDLLIAAEVRSSHLVKVEKGNQTVTCWFCGVSQKHFQDKARPALACEDCVLEHFRITPEQLHDTRRIGIVRLRRQSQGRAIFNPYYRPFFDFSPVDGQYVKGNAK